MGQAWAAFELEQNNLERAQELEDLQRMSSLQIVWPRNFAAGFAPPSTMASPGISLDPILSTVMHSCRHSLSTVSIAVRVASCSS